MGDSPELVGARQDQYSFLRSYLSKLQRETIAVYEKLIVPKNEIDARVIKLEKALNAVNEKRANTYGFTYNQPEVVYLNAPMTFEISEQIKDEIRGTQMEKSVGNVFSVAGTFSQLPNVVVVYCKGFFDGEIDAYYTSFLLRHEMAHAGSVQKISVRQSKNDFAINIQPRRVGPIEFYSRRGTVGVAIAEGHNSIEDSLMWGGVLTDQEIRPWNVSGFIDLPERLMLLEGRNRYTALQKRLESSGEIPEGKTLTGYRPNSQSVTSSYTSDYKEFMNLMRAIYVKAPQMYRFTEDLIYGDRIIAFAKEMDRVFGKDSFASLMSVTTPEEAKMLTTKIGT